MLNYRDVPQTGATRGWVTIVRWDGRAARISTDLKPGGEPLKK